MTKSARGVYSFNPTVVRLGPIRRIELLMPFRFQSHCGAIRTPYSPPVVVVPPPSFNPTVVRLGPVSCLLSDRR